MNGRLYSFVFIFVLTSSFTNATIITVDSTSDGNYYEGACISSSEFPCTIRNALTDCVTYSIANCEILLTPGEIYDIYSAISLTATSSISIQFGSNGEGDAPIITPSNINSYQFLNLDGGSYSVSLTMQYLNITNFGNTESYGGAVSLTALSQVLLNSVEFTYNVAYNGGSIAIQSISGSIQLVNCTFEHNIAASMGGGVYISGESSDNTTITNCIFRNNYATYGSMILLNTGVSNVLIDNCIFDDNEASNEGGIVLWTRNDDITIQNSYFTNNYAHSYASTIDQRYIANNLNIYNCTFDSNHASGTGISIIAFIDKLTNATISDCNFISNYNINNGVIYFQEHNSDISMTNNLFYDNSKPGIFLYNENTFLYINNNNFTSNYGSNGGAIFIDHYNYDITFEDNIFHSNTANRGAGVYVHEYSARINFYNCQFFNNQVTYFGSMIYFAYAASDIVIDNCLFHNNVASSHGGIVVYGYNNNIQILNSNFSYNNGGDSGAGIDQLDVVTNLTIHNCIFEHNSAGYGGALSLFSQLNNGIITNNKFMFNTMTSYGAIFFGFSSYDVLIDNNLFYNNSASSGSAIFILIASNNIEISNNVFYGNVATGYATVSVFYQHSKISITKCIFAHNTAPMGTGVFFNSYNLDSIVISKCKFDHNVASDNGGAIKFESDNNVVHVYDSTFDDNVAQYGGAIFFVQNSNTLILLRSTFNNNFARTGSGSAVCTNYGSDANTQAYLLSCTFSDNTGTDICNWTPTIASNASSILMSYAVVGGDGTAYYSKPLVGMYVAIHATRDGVCYCNLFNTSTVCVFSSL